MIVLEVGKSSYLREVSNVMRNGFYRRGVIGETILRTEIGKLLLPKGE